MAAAEQAGKPMLQHALDYLSMGYPVFPVCSPLMGEHEHWSHQRRRMVPCLPEKWGKTPLTTWREYQTALPSPDEVRSWWRRWPLANIGMATGALSGIIVLDCDSGDARQLALDKGGLETTPAVWTGKPGGIHFWIAHPGYEVRNFVREIPGTDFRGDGGYVLLPPSVHRNHNAKYRWNEHTIGRKLAPCPDWLAELLKDRRATPGDGGAFTGEVLDVDAMLGGFDQGERDTGLFKLACRFRHDDQPRAYAEAMIQVAAQNCRPPFDVDNAIEKVRYVYQKYEAGGIGPSVDEDGYFSAPGAAAIPQTDPPPEVFTRPISELLAMAEEDPDWMVDQLFTVGSNGWVAAEPKVGKSWVVLELAYALSTGQPFLGRFAVKQPRVVLYVQEEDSIQRVLRRLKRIIKGDPLRAAPPDEYLRWSVRAGFRLDNLAWLEKLRQDIETYRAEVIILDVFNRLHGSDENKQAEMTAILNNLTRLTHTYGCSFIIVHHNRKPQQGNEARGNQMMRGSGVLAGWGECSLYLKRSKEKDTIIVTPESKDAPEMEDFSVTLQDQDNGGIFLQIGETAVAEQLSKGDEAVLDAVEASTRRGIGATARAIADALGKDRSTVQARLTRLVKAGYLTAAPISSTHNPTIIYERVSQ